MKALKVYPYGVGIEPDTMGADHIMGSSIRTGRLEEYFSGGQQGHVTIDTVISKRLLLDDSQRAG